MKDEETHNVIDTQDKPTQEISVLKEMILWWEKKRIIYNIILIALLTYLINAWWDYPMRVMIGDKQVIVNAIIWLFGANLFYTFAWLPSAIRSYFTKISGLNKMTRWVIFILGTLFSIMWTIGNYSMQFDILFAGK